MKKQIKSVMLLFLITATFFSCKKDNESVKARITGKWSVSIIVVSGYTGTDDLTKNGTFTYGTTADYVDFKANNDDQVELSLASNRTIGTYIGTQDGFNMSFPSEGDSYCTINTLTANQLQFTAKIDKTSVVKVYYLTR